MNKTGRKILSIICCFSMLIFMCYKDNIFAKENTIEEPVIEEKEIDTSLTEETIKEVQVSSTDTIEEVIKATITIEKNTIYANGIPIIIKKGNDGNKYIYNENGELLTPTAITATTIYGGSKNAVVNGSTSVTVESIGGLTIYGGGYSDGGDATVTGNTKVLVTGSCNAGTIYGGGYAYAKNQEAIANVLGSTTVTVSATPTGNHDRIHGGGYAVVLAQYNAEASVASTNVSFVGRAYAGYGGGYATTNSNSTGKAIANVKGNVTFTVNNADVRETYAGGYAISYSATGSSEANVKNVTSVINNSELMSHVGAGNSHNGIANVEGKATSIFTNCYLYGYIRGAGEAYVGGISNTGSVELTIKDSEMPIDTQFGEYVSTGINGGGYAASATAKVFNDVKMSVIGGTSAATITGAGHAIKNGNDGAGSDCSVGNITILIDGVKASYYQNEPTPFKSSIVAGGERDIESVVAYQDSKITMSNSELEDIIGGELLNYSEYASTKYPSSLICNDSTATNGLYYFDDIYLKNSITVTDIVGKADTTPTILHYTNGVKGTPLITYLGVEASTNWFVMDHQDILYKDNVFSIGDTFYSISAKNNFGGILSNAGNTKVYQGEDLTYTITPNVGYKILRVTVNDQEVSLINNQYTFKNINNDQTINVVFIKEIPEIVIPPNPQVPTIIINNAEQLASLYSDEDKELIAQGKNVTFQLDVQSIEAPKEEVVKEIQKELSDTRLVVAGYLDICFNKLIDEQVSSMSTINHPLELTLDIPIQFIVEKRDFSILRVHQLENGSYVTEILEDNDNDPKTITFSTDKFSIYSLVYEDPKIQDTIPPIVPPITPEVPNEKLPTNQETNSTVDTGDHTNIEMDVVTMISSLFIVFYLYKKK